MLSLDWSEVGSPCTRMGRGAQPLSSTMPSMPEKVTKSPSWNWWFLASFLRVRMPGEPWRRSGLAQRARTSSTGSGSPSLAHTLVLTWEMCWMAAVRGSASVGSCTVKFSPKSQNSCLWGGGRAHWGGSRVNHRDGGEGWETLEQAQRARIRLGSWSLSLLQEQVWRLGGGSRGVGLEARIRKGC